MLGSIDRVRIEEFSLVQRHSLAHLKLDHDRRDVYSAANTQSTPLGRGVPLATGQKSEPPPGTVVVVVVERR